MTYPPVVARDRAVRRMFEALWPDVQWTDRGQFQEERATQIVDDLIAAGILGRTVIVDVDVLAKALHDINHPDKPQRWETLTDVGQRVYRIGAQRLIATGVMRSMTDVLQDIAAKTMEAMKVEIRPWAELAVAAEAVLADHYGDQPPPEDDHTAMAELARCLGVTRAGTVET